MPRHFWLYPRLMLHEGFAGYGTCTSVHQRLPKVDKRKRVRCEGSIMSVLSSPTRIGLSRWTFIDTSIFQNRNGLLLQVISSSSHVSPFLLCCSMDSSSRTSGQIQNSIKTSLSYLMFASRAAGAVGAVSVAAVGASAMKVNFVESSFQGKDHTSRPLLRF